MNSNTGFWATIVAFYFLYQVFLDTRVDVLQKPFLPTEKQLFFTDPALNPTKGFRDGPECQTYQNIIMDPKTQKLGEVFNLNVVPIHNRAFEIMILTLIILLAYAVIIIGALIIEYVPSLKLIMSIVLYASRIVLIIASLLMNLGFILILYFFFSSDNGVYSRFLECRNVDYSGFARFRDAESLRSDFYFYLVCNIICSICNYMVDKPKENDENEKNIKNE